MKTKTRMDSATRVRLIQTHNIKPVYNQIMEEKDTAHIRMIGRQAASKLSAILARRSSFHVGN